MKFAGRACVISEIDPVPSGLRVGPNALVLSRAEARALRAGDAEVKARLQRAIDAHDRKRLVERLARSG